MFFVFQLPFNVTRFKCTSKISVRLGIGLGLGPKTGKDRTIKKKVSDAFRKTPGAFITTTADGIHPTFFGRYTYIFYYF